MKTLLILFILSMVHSHNYVDREDRISISKWSDKWSYHMGYQENRSLREAKKKARVVCKRSGGYLQPDHLNDWELKYRIKLVNNRRLYKTKAKLYYKCRYR